MYRSTIEAMAPSTAGLESSWAESPSSVAYADQDGQPARHRVKLVLHHAIVSGIIPEGSRLVQSSIARELEVSTRPVRDALRELASEGLVRMDARGAATVHEMCRSDLEEIYQIRMLLEPLAAARAAAAASQDTVLRAAELLAAMESETQADRWAEYNSSFHRVIDESGNSVKLVVILENLRQLSARYIRHSLLAVPDRTRQARAEHEEILRAVVARDPTAAADAALRHLDSTLSTLDIRQLGAVQGGTRSYRRPRRRDGACTWEL
jgi:DNA-binding GntR family transcriptional regulator